MDTRSKIISKLAEVESIFKYILSCKEKTIPPQLQDGANAILASTEYEMTELKDKQRRSTLSEVDLDDLNEEADAMLEQAQLNKIQINKIVIASNTALGTPDKIAAQALIKKREQDLAKLLGEKEADNAKTNQPNTPNKPTPSGN